MPSRGLLRTCPGCMAGHVDLADEGSIAADATRVVEPAALTLVTTGRLDGEGLTPEHTAAAQDAEALAQSLSVNTIGPALVAKPILPLMPKDRRAVFAVLSARVGSMEDIRLGGWYGDRAAKAALNMVVRCLEVELRRTHLEAICVPLQPGTVGATLSLPFQRGVKPEKLFSPTYAVGRLLEAWTA